MGPGERILTIGGGLWGLIGITNIFAGCTVEDLGYDAFLLMFNIIVFVVPGGVLARIGPMLRNGSRGRTAKPGEAVGPAPPAPRGGDRGRHDTAMRILGLALLLACLPAPRPATAQSPAPLTPPFLLVGVIIPEAGEPMAITEDPQTHEQEIHILGAQIGDVRLTKILKDRVLLTSGEVAIEVRLAGPVPRPSRPIPSRPAPGRARLSGPR